MCDEALLTNLSAKSISIFLPYSGKWKSAQKIQNRERKREHNCVTTQLCHMSQKLEEDIVTAADK